MVQTRYSNSSPLSFDPDIERSLSRLKRRLEFDTHKEMGDEVDYPPRRTLRSLKEPNLNMQPLAIRLPALPEGSRFEYKSNWSTILPNFHGLPVEEPNKHLANFASVCDRLRPQGLTDDQLMLRVFPFTLKDSASDWLYYLPPESIMTCVELKKSFLQKYFPATNLNKLKKELSSIEQSPTKSLYEYVERFKRLKGNCSQHCIPRII